MTVPHCFSFTPLYVGQFLPCPPQVHRGQGGVAVASFLLEINGNAPVTLNVDGVHACVCVFLVMCN